MTAPTLTRPTVVEIIPAPATLLPSTTLPPTTTAAQTPRLGRRALLHEHRVTLESPRRRYSLIAQMLFRPMDLVYGRRGSLEKFMVLEIVARIPYQIWENAAYRMLGRRHRDAGLAHRIQERIVENREQQDNEQWHLLIMSELVAARGGGRSRLLYRVLPWLMALTYYHVSWLLFVVAPAWSYRLNADFEDHAEHTYAEYVAAHPELETQPHGSEFARRYGAHSSMADLLRQIGHDERMHKQESERYLVEAPLS
jgi:ubiquinol oxidase